MTTATANQYKGHERESLLMLNYATGQLDRTGSTFADHNASCLSLLLSFSTIANFNCKKEVKSNQIEKLQSSCGFEITTITSLSVALTAPNTDNDDFLCFFFIQLKQFYSIIFLSAFIVSTNQK